jgi:hypothetical protein
VITEVTRLEGKEVGTGADVGMNGASEGGVGVTEIEDPGIGGPTGLVEVGEEGRVVVDVGGPHSTEEVVNGKAI